MALSLVQLMEIVLLLATYWCCSCFTRGTCRNNNNNDDRSDNDNSDDGNFIEAKLCHHCMF